MSDEPTRVSPAEKAALLAITHLSRALGDVVSAIGQNMLEEPDEAIAKLQSAQDSLNKVQETLERFLEK